MVGLFRGDNKIDSYQNDVFSTSLIIIEHMLS